MSDIRRFTKWLSAGSAALLMLDAGCSVEPAQVLENPTPSDHFAFEVVPSCVDMVAATRALGLSILADNATETIVTSPASTVIALSMLGSGATGDAEAEFAAVLGVGGQTRDEAANALLGTLKPFSADLDEIDLEDLPSDPQIHLANQMVLNEGFTPEAEYSESLQKWFGVVIATMDLSSASGKKYLDAWVRANTAGLIEESAIEPSSGLRLVVQNAVLLVSQWQEPFDAGSSGPADFTLPTGEVVNTEFMSSRRLARYAEMDRWQMVELPYGSEGQLVALYVSPREGVEPTDLTPAKLSDLESLMTGDDVVVEVPIVDLASSLDLIPSLESLGLTSIFSWNPPALGYISESGDLMVSLINQQGRIQIDEAGTAAAAVTEIAVTEGAAAEEPTPPKYFIADRPHLVLITDTLTGWDFFQILVNDPRGDED